MDWEQSKLFLSVSQADVLWMILQYCFALQNELGGTISKSHDAQNRLVKKIDFMCFVDVIVCMCVYIYMCVCVCVCLGRQV